MPEVLSGLISPEVLPWLVGGHVRPMSSCFPPSPNTLPLLVSSHGHQGVQRKDCIRVLLFFFLSLVRMAFAKERHRQTGIYTDRHTEIHTHIHIDRHIQR